MNKISINAPVGTRCLGDWKDFSLDNFPGPAVLSVGHGVTGITDYLLGPESGNIILASPSELTLRNLEEPDRLLYVTGKTKDLENYIRSSKGSCKILVHWSNLETLLRNLEDFGILAWFRTVVTDLQAIMTDDRYYSILETTKTPGILYLTTDNSLDTQLSMIPEFLGLNFYTVSWGTTWNQGKVVYKKKSSKSMQGILTEFLSNKMTGVSKLVIFVNTLKTVKHLIESNNLNPTQVTISSIAPAHPLINLGFSEWKKGDNLKPINFIVGHDFYGTKIPMDNTRSYVISGMNNNLDSLASDVSTCLSDILDCCQNQKITLLYDVYNKNFIKTMGSKKQFLDTVDEWTTKSLHGIQDFYSITYPEEVLLDIKCIKLIEPEYYRYLLLSPDPQGITSEIPQFYYLKKVTDLWAWSIHKDILSKLP